MAAVLPFRAIRPKAELAERIAALPYDVYNRKEAKEETLREPYSFLKIDRAETQFDDSVDTYADIVYEKAKETLWNMLAEGQFIQEEQPCYYVYELVMDGRAQTGITACASIDDYIHNIIKEHENTRADKELDRIRHVETCMAQTGPIFLAYRGNDVINECIQRAKKNEPVYDFTAPDGIMHRVWIIQNEADIEAIGKAFDGMQDIYIADGHHRCASAVKVGLKRRAENPDYDGSEEFNYFLSVLFSDDQLMIMDYNRVVKDLNGYTVPEFLNKVSAVFEMTEMGEEAYRPLHRGEMGMYIADTWYKLLVKEAERPKDPVEGLDVSVLQAKVLDAILGITDPKTDTRIDFVGGIRGLAELERRVKTDCVLAFAMYPTSIKELFDVADAGMLMPPKSTWFEPKLRSGLFIHSIR